MHDTSNDVKPRIEDFLPDGLRPRRIAVIGRAGAGKTTVARRLGEELGLPVIHLDRLAWDPGWQPVDEGTFATRQDEAVAGEAWVIDGGYLSSVGWPERLRRADLVVLVEAPLVVCLGRIIRRSLAGTCERRLDLPEGCEERLSLAFIGWTLAWRWRTRSALRVLDDATGRVRRARPRLV